TELTRIPVLQWLTHWLPGLRLFVPGEPLISVMVKTVVDSAVFMLRQSWVLFQNICAILHSMNKASTGLFQSTRFVTSTHRPRPRATERGRSAGPVCVWRTA